MKQAEKAQRLLRRIYGLGGSAMALGGLFIVGGALAGWYWGLTPSGVSHFSPVHGFSKAVFYGLIIAPAVYYLIASYVTKRLPLNVRRQFLGLSLLATVAMGFALAAGIGAARPWRQDNFVAEKLHFGIWYSLAGAAVGLIGAGVTAIAVAAEEELRKEAEAKVRRSERSCPYCAEPIKAEARICKHCGSNVTAVYS